MLGGKEADIFTVWCAGGSDSLEIKCSEIHVHGRKEILNVVLSE